MMFSGYLCCTEYYLEDVIQMLSFVPPLPEKKKKREETEDDEEVGEISNLHTTSDGDDRVWLLN